MAGAPVALGVGVGEGAAEGRARIGGPAGGEVADSRGERKVARESDPGPLWAGGRGRYQTRRATPRGRRC